MRNAVQLLALPYSPWSEKARWALDHHRVPYREEEYLPMLGELGLRLRLRRLSGRVSVPVLFTEAGTVGDSFDIARWAESAGTGARLFPAGREAELASWNQRSEAALAAARALIMPRLAADPEAQREALPSLFPKALHGALTPAAAFGSWYVARKWGIAPNVVAHRTVCREALDALRAGLEQGGGYLVDGHFSYADLCMAVALQGVRPAADAHLPMGPASRRCWTDEELEREYGDLLAWRDGIYARHRRSAAPAPSA